MRAAEIIGCDVYDRDGEHLGRVHDLRFTKEPGNVRGRKWYRLTGFECRSAPLGHRLGYGRTDMAGPWLFNVIFRALAARAVVVDWDDVARFERPRIDLSKPRTDLTPAEEART